RIRHKLPEQDVPWWKFLSTVSRGERFVLLASAAALVLAAFIAGRYLPRQERATESAAGRQATPPGATNGDHSVQRQRILLSSVADHLDRSERVLTDIMNTADTRDISVQQRWADDLLTTSRLYRQDAEDVGERSVASVLDDLERSLLEIVHSPSRISAAD